MNKTYRNQENGNERQVAGSPDQPARTWRIVQRKYGPDGTIRTPADYSAQFVVEGAEAFFPLVTTQPAEAEQRAARIHAFVEKRGWPAALNRFPREITLCIFWNEQPVACTYATLFTHLKPMRPARSEQRPRNQMRIAILEPDATVRETLADWAASLSGATCVAEFSKAHETLNPGKLRSVDLLFVNRQLAGLSTFEFQNRFRKLAPEKAVFSYGIFPHSDAIFASMSGVELGYFFRRRKPRDLLEPIAEAWRAGTHIAEPLEASIRRYFQNLLQPRAKLDAAKDSPLTQREEQVLLCLRDGYHDKQIASALGVQPSTIHTHLKHIFEKLGVHTRTEAVMRHLQK